MSSTAAKGPCSSRYATIRSASTSPMPGSAVSSAAPAVLMFSFPAGSAGAASSVRTALSVSRPVSADTGASRSVRMVTPSGVFQAAVSPSSRNRKIAAADRRRISVLKTIPFTSACTPRLNLLY